MTGASLTSSHDGEDAAALWRSLERAAAADPGRSAVRLVVTFVVSGFLFAYVSVPAACLWLAAAVVCEAVSEWSRGRVAEGRRDFANWYLGSVLGITLLWVVHAGLLWAQHDEIARIAALIDLFTVALYGALGGHKDKRIMAVLMGPPLCALAAFLIHAAWVDAPIFVSVIATLATLGACATIAANGLAMHRSDRMLAEALAALEVERNSLERRVATRTNELHEAHKALEAASRAKSLFLNTMSHELRTPLNGILGYAEILLEDLEAGVGDAADVRHIIVSGQRLQKMVENVLDLASLEAGRASVDWNQTDLEGLIRAATPGSSERLRVQVAPDARSIVTDQRLLGQIIGHLVDNALKYAPGGAIDVCASKNGSGQIVVDVIDRGPGMAASEIARIFEPFEQGSQGFARAAEGAGLGLAITIRLARLLGGKVAAISLVGEGTTMRVTLPQSVGVPAPVRDVLAVG